VFILASRVLFLYTNIYIYIYLYRLPSSSTPGNPSFGGFRRRARCGINAAEPCVYLHQVMYYVLYLYALASIMFYSYVLYYNRRIIHHTHSVFFFGCDCPLDSQDHGPSVRVMYIFKISNTISLLYIVYTIYG